MQRSDEPAEKMSVSPAEAEGRVAAIDALRGFDMFWLAGGGLAVSRFCNLFADPLPPGLDRQFEHVPWEGFVGWDLIMPLFLFIVGAAMPFSVGKRVERGEGRWKIYGKVLYRVAMLWVLGMVAQGNLLQFKLDTLHLYSNTLQAIAAGYLISAIAIVELPARWHGVLAGALLAVYWALLKFVPVPGGVAGDLTPHGNLAMWVDTVVLGHFRDGTDYTWILSSLGFGATTLLGVMAGQLLRGEKPGPKKVLLLTAWGTACLLGGWLWSFEFPIIKHIWASSMVLWSGGWCLLLLALFYWLMDVLRWRRWAFFFMVYGANSLVAYMAPDLISFGKISHTMLDGAAAHVPKFASFLLAAGAVGILWLVLYYLYRKKTFIRI